jgi:hypothetical protein
MVAVAPAYVLSVDRAFIVSGLTAQPTFDPAGHTLAAGNGLRGSAAANGATGTVTALNGMNFAVVNSGANSVGAAAGVKLDAFVSSGGGATTSYTGFTMTNSSLSSGTLATQIGLDIPTLSGATTNYSIRTGTTPSLFGGVIIAQNAATVSAPTYVKGGIYFDTTLSKLRIGGATAWETVTSV